MYVRANVYETRVGENVVYSWLLAKERFKIRCMKILGEFRLDMYAALRAKISQRVQLRRL